jgi:CRP-like cAMP-binding protein
MRFEDGRVIARQGEKSYITYLLLQGRVRIERNDEVLAVESREGVFLGEISTLTGTERTASMIADGEVWACAFNLPDLERLVTCNPAVGIRMIKTLAERIAGDRLRQTYGSQEKLKRL